MTSPPAGSPEDPVGDAGDGFPMARRGYDRTAVDKFVRAVSAEITVLRRSHEALAARYGELQASELAEQRSAELTRLGGLGAQAEREAAATVAAATAEAGRLLAAARSQVEAARREAAMVEERSRQELAWRRRQLRSEQGVLTRRRQAMLSQLATLSALAAETAERMPEVPDLVLTDGEPAEPWEHLEQAGRPAPVA